MFILPLIVVCLCFPRAMSKAPFNFRGSCYVNHYANSFSASCDGSSKHITTKNLFLDNRTTTGMTEMNLTNFESVTLDSGVGVQKIKITSTNRVSVYISNTNLEELVLDSVGEVTLKYYGDEKRKLRKMVRLVLLDIERLQFTNEWEGKFNLPINIIKISNVNDFALESLQLYITSTNVSITETNVNCKDQSSFVLETVSTNMTNVVMYIHDAGYFKIQADSFSMVDSKIDLENGILEVSNSKDVVFARNSLYGFENNSLSLHGYSNVKFLKNNIFTKNIANLLTVNRERLTFKDNTFGCTECGGKEKLLGVDLKDVGEVNYCYTDCKLSLNTYKKLLDSFCVCSDGETSTAFAVLCGMCVLKNETSYTDILYNINPLWYILLTVILLLLIILVLGCICHKRNIYKMKTLVTTSSLECVNGQELDDSHTVIYRKHDSSDEDSVCNYDHIGNLRLK